uniref:histidine--tRNA ligase n=1 Tax=Erythroglossum lusitanicum TaxID=2575615 RepID=A0A4D6WTV2_9FLOR|nr:Histidine-tRNA ligase [Erythroglossum lusitanicum]
MQPLRGTKDILPNETYIWQYIYEIAEKILSLSNYKEIRTPIIENTSLFTRSIGDDTDIINKEMYTFEDQGKRKITLRPEGTASIARAFISNKLYIDKKVQRLWYYGPMFRYERPQYGRQRQFHQLGIECIGSLSPIADIEVIRLAIKILNILNCSKYTLEINSIGNLEERNIYKEKLIDYLTQYKEDLDEDSKKRLYNNPLRILDSKNSKTQEILLEAPQLQSYLNSESIKHFHEICDHLQYLNIHYNINTKLVRGLDYYNYTAFEIKTKELNNQNTICGGGRYDKLIEQLGGPNTPSVGWAIGLERLLLIIQNNLNLKNQELDIYIAIKGYEAQQKIWNIIEILEEYNIRFELNLNQNNLQKQLKKANQLGAKICLIMAENEIINQYITIKYLKTGRQEIIKINNLRTYLYSLKSSL